MSELEGTWKSDCTASDNNEYEKGIEVFAGANITFTNTVYSDANCATESLSFVATGTHTVGAAVTTPSGAKEFNSTVSKVMLTLQTDTMVSVFNGDVSANFKVCGGGFAKGTAKELTATTCKDDTIFGPMFDESFGIYKVDGTKLYFGELGDKGSATDGSAATKRPTSLDTKYSTKS